MDIRDLIKAMDLLENGIQVDEAFNAKTIEKQVSGIADEQQRAQALAKIALDNGLPGLYDPIKGNFVNTQGQISNTADKDTDYLLASKGLMPKTANTSTFFGRMFGTSGDKYDAGLRGQSDQVIAGQEAEEFKREKLTQLQTLMKELLAMKPGATKTAEKPADGQGAGSSLGKGLNQAKTAVKDASAAIGQAATPTFKDEPGSLKVYKESTSLSSALIESFGYESKEKQTDEGIGAVLGRAAPGVGAALGAMDAVDRWKQGDKTGAVLAGLSGAFSLVPGLGWIPALGFAAANMARDYAKGQSADAGQGASASPTQGGDQKLMKLQKIIGANPDGIMGPETKGKLQAWQQKQGITADGLPGPETYGKAGIKESVAESMRSLQQRLAMLEAEDVPNSQPDGLDAKPEAEVKPDAPSQQEASLADMVTKAGGQFVEFPPGHPKAGMQVLVIKKDVGPIVDAKTMEILDNTTLAPTGQQFDPQSAGLSEGQLDEGLWDSIVKGALALGRGASNVGKNFVSGVKGGGTVQQMVKGPRGGQIAGKIATGGRTANKLGKSVNAAGKVIKNNPGKTIAGMAGLGYLSGMGGNGQGQSASPTGGGGGAGGAGDTGTADQGPTCTPEMIAKIGEIQKVMGELSSKIKDPAVEQVIASYQEKIDALNCQSQSASPTQGGPAKWTGVQYGTPNS